MAAPPNKPNIQASAHVKTNQQPPARIIENAPALANGARQVREASK